MRFLKFSVIMIFIFVSVNPFYYFPRSDWPGESIKHNFPIVEYYIFLVTDSPCALLLKMSSFLFSSKKILCCGCKIFAYLDNIKFNVVDLPVPTSPKTIVGNVFGFSISSYIIVFLLISLINFRFYLS
jgi:hypothetical protein